ncbi:MAG TPA: protein kinase, partial [Gemmatimonadaceae bacterium]|nr:protein kinase [Gemmatimonadaceae bacterium]
MSSKSADRPALLLAERYRVGRELGRGGMATVYLAEDLKHNRDVAVKILNPEVAAVLTKDRFVREIDIAAHLNHPHVVALF